MAYSYSEERVLSALREFNALLSSLLSPRRPKHPRPASPANSPTAITPPYKLRRIADSNDSTTGPSTSPACPPTHRLLRLADSQDSDSPTLSCPPRPFSPITPPLSVAAQEPAAPLPSQLLDSATDSPSSGPSSVPRWEYSRADSSLRVESGTAAVDLMGDIPPTPAYANVATPSSPVHQDEEPPPLPRALESASPLEGILESLYGSGSAPVRRSGVPNPPSPIRALDAFVAQRIREESTTPRPGPSRMLAPRPHQAYVYNLAMHVARLPNFDQMTCGICQANIYPRSGPFNVEVCLRFHLYTHYGPYFCRVCGWDHWDERALRNHWAFAHPDYLGNTMAFEDRRAINFQEFETKIYGLIQGCYGRYFPHSQPLTNQPLPS